MNLVTGVSVFLNCVRVCNQFTNPEVVLIGMIGPLMSLIKNIKSYDLSIRVLGPEEPSLDTCKHLASFHVVGVEPVGPVIQILSFIHSIGDGVPPLRFLRHLRIIACFYEKFIMFEKNSEKFVFRCVVVVVGTMFEW